MAACSLFLLFSFPADPLLLLQRGSACRRARTAFVPENKPARGSPEPVTTGALRQLARIPVRVTAVSNGPRGSDPVAFPTVCTPCGHCQGRRLATQHMPTAPPCAAMTAPGNSAYPPRPRWRPPHKLRHQRRPPFCARRDQPGTVSVMRRHHRLRPARTVVHDAATTVRGGYLRLLPFAGLVVASVSALASGHLVVAAVAAVALVVSTSFLVAYATVIADHCLRGDELGGSVVVALWSLPSSLLNTAKTAPVLLGPVVVAVLSHESAGPGGRATVFTAVSVSVTSVVCAAAYARGVLFVAPFSVFSERGDIVRAALRLGAGNTAALALRVCLAASPGLLLGGGAALLASLAPSGAALACSLWAVAVFAVALVQLGVSAATVGSYRALNSSVYSR